MTTTIQSLTFNNTVQLQEIIALGIQGLNNPSLQLKFGQQLQLSQFPNVAQGWSGEVTLSGGAATLDLTNLPFGNLPDINAIGQALRLIAIQADSGNTAALAVKPGASNPYPGWVGANGLSLNANDQQVLGPLWSGAAIGSGAKTIDFTSPMPAALAQVFILFG